MEVLYKKPDLLVQKIVINDCYPLPFVLFVQHLKAINAIQAVIGNLFFAIPYRKGDIVCGDPFIQKVFFHGIGPAL
jgi:hypothetical protein